ncbi:MAG: tRNA threonylcarbamoyladenosine biosynthesis protein TsaB [Candidatus Anoxychlamydiales bacterium]|nr:tRNA threonylcarbamoyladenosine biosynthesis protein TsaB [Candidatus Anoxychlamydiales bacterium]
MISLILDTTLESSFVIISKNSKVIFLKKIENNKHLSTHLMPTINSAFEKLNIKLDNLSFIGCSMGPGSYTGLRVGASIAKTFSYIKRIPIIPFSSLNVYHIENETSYLSLINAKTPGVYLVKTKLINNKKIFTTPEIIPIEGLNKYFEKTNNIVSFENDLLKIRLKEYFTLNSLNFFNPHEYENNLINYCEEKFLNNKGLNFENFNLLYLRGPVVAK